MKVFVCSLMSHVHIHMPFLAIYLLILQYLKDELPVSLVSLAGVGWGGGRILPHYKPHKLNQFTHLLKVSDGLWLINWVLHES